MSSQYQNPQAGQINNRPHPCNQNRPPITEAKIKDIVLETLIELNLIPKPERKKALTTV